ncbi:MAG: hypothetical protein Q7K43_04580 [Candidatus Woesearchaeota archaeon]|nr:hypothetical protein [Candidatus Woesearchaeota archaeon]
MIIETNTYGHCCCNHCKDDFRDGKQMFVVTELARAGDLLIYKGAKEKLEIIKPTKVKLFCKQCFFLESGEEWWASND